MQKKIMLIAALLPAVAALAGDLTTDNLTVTTNATILGTLNISSLSTTYDTNTATATGGTITTNGNYVIHTFTNVGTTNFIVSGGSITCDVLIVAGGGGGGLNYGGGGGGAGGLIYTSVVASTCEIVVGSGGAGAVFNNNRGANGENSSFEDYIAFGGGGGGGGPIDPNKNGADGGCGGGGSLGNGGVSIQTNGYGFSGGNSSDLNPYYPGGGGGGASEAGGTCSTGYDYGGKGGDGKSYDISGVNKYYAGGGGGFSCPGGAGGLGGGGDGGKGGEGYGNQPGENGEANTGGGGGGGGSEAQGSGGNGGSGIVIVRYSISSSSNVTTLSLSSNGINQANTSGENVFMGKVGIGTNDPAEKLHVAGNVQFDGSIKFGGETRTNWPSGAEGALMISNNLNDVADKAAARANLGLGDIATNNSGAFMTPTGDGSQLTNITATQVGALSANAGALLAANNLSELTNTASAARANLGLGSAATNNTGDFLAPTGDGSQLTGITAAQVGALSTNGGVVSGAVSLMSPGGDVPMGVYTNQ